MEGDNPIDKLFKEGLQQDKPPFKEAYWKGFEEILTNVPLSPPAAPASGMAKIIASITLTKGIIAVVSIVAVSIGIYFGVKKDHQHTPASDIVLSTQTTINTRIPATENQDNETVINESNSPAHHIINETKEKLSLNSINSAQNSKISTHTLTLSNVPVSEYSGAKGDSYNEKSLAQSAVSMPESKPSSSHPVLEAKGQLTQEKTNLSEENLSERKGGEVFSSLPVGVSDITPVSNESIKEPVRPSSAISPEERYADSAFRAVTANDVNSKVSTGDRSVNSKPSKSKFYLVPGIALYKPMGNTEDYSSPIQTAFQFGAGYSYQISKLYSVYTEINALRIKGFKLTESSLNNNYLFHLWVNNVTVESREYNLVNVPVLGRVHFNRHTMSLGPVFRFIAASSGEQVIIDSSLNVFNYHHQKAENFLAGIHQFQTGICLEYAMNFYRQNAILIRYDLMLNDFTRSSYYPGFTSEKLNLFQVALRFHIY